MGVEDVESFQDGIVHFEWSSIRKALINIASAIPVEASNIVLYVITTPSMAIPTSSQYRQLAAIISRSLHPSPSFDDRVLFHFVPQDVVFEPRAFPTNRHLGLETFVTSVYDRLLRKVERLAPRRLFKYDLVSPSRFVQVPSFTLARHPTPELSYILADWPVPSANISDRHRQLHIGYQITADEQWLIMACIDELGETYDLRTKSLGAGRPIGDDLFEKVVEKVMAFTAESATKANIEWSIVIARLGTIAEKELQGMSLLP